MIEKLKTLAKSRKLSRREFIQGAVAAGLAIPAADRLFTTMAMAEPKQGGRFRMGLGSGSTTDTLDPGSIPDTYNQVVAYGSLRSGLTDVTPDGKIVPDVADSYESSKDAKQWVFKLRKGVEFHDGKSLDADDVVASYRHHMGADSRSAAKPLLADLADVKADGKDTVIFTLSSANADFPYVTYDYHIPVMPVKDGKVDWESGIGTGPYQKVDYQPGVRFEGKRFANFHGQTYFDEVEVLPIIDVAARMNALASGEIDFADRADLKTLDMMKSNPEIEVSEVSGFAHYTAPMNCTLAPFNDRNVRLAVKYAIDREELVKKVLLGHGTAGNDNPVAKGVPFHAEPKIKHSYDPDKVKFYLKEAGLTSLKVDLSTAEAAFAGAVDSALLMKESAAKAGIDINVIREPNDGYWSNVWLKKPWCFCYWNGRTTVDAMLTTAYVGGAAWNDTFWTNADFDKMLAAARSELDDKKRAEMYAELQNLLAEDGGAIVLMFNNFVNVHAKKVAHGAISPNYDVDGLKITQRWWFA